MALSCFFILENDKWCLMTKPFAFFVPAEVLAWLCSTASAPFYILCWLTSAHHEGINQDLQLPSWRRLTKWQGLRVEQIGHGLRLKSSQTVRAKQVFVVAVCFLIEKAACCPSASPAAPRHAVPCGLQSFGQCFPFGSAARSSAGAVRWGVEHS